MKIDNKRQFYFLLAFLFFGANSFCQQNTFIKCFPRIYDPHIVITDDNSYLLAGTDGYSLFVKKLFNIGRTNWEKQYSNKIRSSYINSPVLINKTYKNEIFLFCSINEYKDFSNTQSVLYLLKTDSMGGYIWSRTYQQTNQIYVRSLLMTEDSSIVLLSFSYGFNTERNILLNKFNYNGEKIWEKSFPVNDNELYSSSIFNIYSAVDKNILIQGGENILKISKGGDLIWL